MMSLPEIHPPKAKNVFFSMSTRRLAESVDGLDSSLAQSPGELWDCNALQDFGLLRD